VNNLCYFLICCERVAAGSKTPISYSLCYAAPEVVKALEAGHNKMIVDPAVDIWALGVIAYALTLLVLSPSLVASTMYIDIVEVNVLVSSCVSRALASARATPPSAQTSIHLWIAVSPPTRADFFHVIHNMQAMTLQVRAAHTLAPVSFAHEQAEHYGEARRPRFIPLGGFVSSGGAHPDEGPQALGADVPQPRPCAAAVVRSAAPQVRAAGMTTLLAEKRKRGFRTGACATRLSVVVGDLRSCGCQSLCPRMHSECSSPGNWGFVLAERGTLSPTHMCARQVGTHV
jgi:serine/threonine protein kinase